MLTSKSQQSVNLIGNFIKKFNRLIADERNGA